MSTDEQRLNDLISGFNTAMLTTVGLEGDLQSRPMAIADSSEEGELWFVTDRNSEKVFELTGDERVSVTMQSMTKYISLNGSCQLVDDREKISELWNDAWLGWFPDGPGDPRIVLLRMNAESGEFWDMSGFNGLKFLITAGRAYMNGKAIETPDTNHGQVEFTSRS